LALSALKSQSVPKVISSSYCVEFESNTNLDASLLNRSVLRPDCPAVSP
jgi:hypothetical protein